MLTGPQPEPIIVTGKRQIEKEEARSAVRDIAMRGRTFDRPLPRYQTPLCLSVQGMGDVMGPAIERRIKANAREAGLPDNPDPDCATNALVLVTDDKAALIERLRKTQPRIFEPAAQRATRAALRRNDPAIVWSLQRQTAPDGQRLPPGVDGPKRAPMTGIAYDNGGEQVPFTFGVQPSRLSIPFSLERYLTVMVFEARDLDGVHMNQFADYATMRIMIDPQPRVRLETEKADTILTLFDGEPDEAPIGLTALDRAFMRGIYELAPNAPGSRLESFVLAALEREVELVD